MASSWNLAAKKTEETVSNVTNVVSDVTSQYVSKGSSLWQSVVDEAADALLSGKEAVIDVADDVYDALPEQEDIEETASQVGSAVGSVVETVGSLPRVISEGVEKAGSNLLESGTSEFRFFLQNYFKPGSTVSEDNLNETDIRILRDTVAKAKEEGRSFVDYEDFQSTQGTVLKGSMLTGLFNPELRMARTLGGFQFKEDKDGNTIVTNTYNFNPGPKRKEYLEAVREGKTMEGLEVLLESATDPVELASILAYAKQELRKDEGEPSETEMVINLGKI